MAVRLNGGVHRHPLQIARPQRASVVCQALDQQKLQFVAKPLAPIALDRSTRAGNRAGKTESR